MSPQPGRVSATARDQHERHLPRPAATAGLRGRGSRRPVQLSTNGICRDQECERYACRIWHEAWNEAWQEGYDTGFAEGIRSCPGPHGG